MNGHCELGKEGECESFPWRCEDCEHWVKDDYFEPKTPDPADYFREGVKFTTPSQKVIEKWKKNGGGTQHD